jgi:hypothetical protein
MRQDQPPESPDEMNDFIEQLASFEAHSMTVNRDQLMFQAGQLAARAERRAEAASARRTLRVWQSAALVLCAFSLGLGTSLVLRPEPQPRIVVADTDRPHEGTNKDPLVAADAGAANAPTSTLSRSLQEKTVIEKSGGTDSATPAAHVIEGLHTRLALVEQMIDVISSPDRTTATAEETLALAHHRTPEPILSHRSLLQGEGSRILINRLIEEPSL